MNNLLQNLHFFGWTISLMRQKVVIKTMTSFLNALCNCIYFQAATSMLIYQPSIPPVSFSYKTLSSWLLVTVHAPPPICSHQWVFPLNTGMQVKGPETKDQSALSNVLWHFRCVNWICLSLIHSSSRILNIEEMKQRKQNLHIMTDSQWLIKIWGWAVGQK